MSEIQANETELSDFARALNSTTNKLENVAETLSATLRKIEKLGLLEKSSGGDTTRSKKGPITEEFKQLTNDATASKETHSETEITTNTRTKLQQSKPDEIQESARAQIINKAFSKSNYYILAIALTIFCIIVVKICFMLFP